MATELLGKSKEELREFCAGLGEPAYRGGQIYHALYAERKFDLAQITNLPAALRERLVKEARVTLPMVKQRFESADGSVRYLFSLEDAEGRRPQRAAQVEAVFMPSEGRQTICISTQAGCAVDCQFCLTAQLGLIRNLTAGEIVAQVLVALEEASENQAEQEAGGDAGATKWAEEDGRLPSQLPPKDWRTGGASRPGASKSRTTAAMTPTAAKRDPIQTNVVLMGQGEPLLNFDEVMRALRILLDPEGMGISRKHVTLSTSGVVPGIEKLAMEKVRPKLAISLNASNDEQRDRLMPINKKYPLGALLEACRNYPLRNWEHLTFEYVMLGDVNDSPEDARRVVRLLAPLKSLKVNLIPWNPGELPYRESSAERIEEFRRILVDKGVPAFVRYSRGRDVMAACGQLALTQIQNATPQLHA
jgi:23S rRNA (adenine2503-C2)-methyltransferase